MNVRMSLLVLGLAVVPPLQAAQDERTPRSDVVWVYRGNRSLSGLTLVAIPEDLRRHYGAPADRGALVTRVEADSVAREVGVQVGDVLIRVGETSIRGADDLRRALWTGAAARPLTLEVVRKGTAVEIDLERRTPPPSPAVPYDVGAGSGAATSVRTRLLESELTRLEQRMREIREELEKLKERP